VNATSSLISFYYDMQAPGNLIGSVSGFPVTAGGTNDAVVNWDTTGLTATSHIVIVDITDAVPMECDESNNNARTEYMLPVELDEFTANAGYGLVLLEWTTQTETDHLGWNLYRATDADQTFRKINVEMIPGAGTSAIPKHYSYTDLTVDIGMIYHYYLESVSYTGDTEHSETVSATPVDGRSKLLAAGFLDTHITTESGGRLTIAALVIDPSESRVESVEIYFDGIPTGLHLHDDGQDGDIAAGNHLYTFRAEVGPGVPASEMLIELVARDSDGVIIGVWPRLIVHGDSEMWSYSAPYSMNTLHQDINVDLFTMVETSSDGPTILAGGFLDTGILPTSGGDILFVVWSTEAESVELLYAGLNTGLYLHDDGLDGDWAAGDLIHTIRFVGVRDLPVGSYLLGAIATDCTGKTSTAYPYLAVE